MIQRIQSLYLLIIVVLGIMACFMPLMEIFDSSYAWMGQLKALGVLSLTEEGTRAFSHYTIGLFLMSVVIPMLSLFVIFLYKRRMVQVRLLIVNLILMLGYYALLVWSCYSAYHLVGGEAKTISIASAFMLVNIILNIMAIHRIRKDEALVRSLDRLR